MHACFAVFFIDSGNFKNCPPTISLLTASFKKSNEGCEMWIRTIDFSPYNRDEDFPEGLLLAKNYCLSPDGNKAWCYKQNQKGQRMECAYVEEYCGNFLKQFLLSCLFSNIICYFFRNFFRAQKQNIFMLIFMMDFLLFQPYEALIKLC